MVVAFDGDETAMWMWLSPYATGYVIWPLVDSKRRPALPEVPPDVADGGVWLEDATQLRLLGHEEEAVPALYGLGSTVEPGICCSYATVTLLEAWWTTTW